MYVQYKTGPTFKQPAVEDLVFFLRAMILQHDSACVFRPGGSQVVAVGIWGSTNLRFPGLERGCAAVGLRPQKATAKVLFRTERALARIVYTSTLMQ